MDSFPKDFCSVDLGVPFNMMARMRLFDLEHDQHLMVSMPSQTQFHLKGPIEFGHDSYSLLRVQLVRQFPSPVVQLCEGSFSIMMFQLGMVCSIWWIYVAVLGE